MSTPLLIFIGSFCGILTAFVGGQRGYNLGIMYLLGFISGPLGIGIAYLLPNRIEAPEEPKPAAEQKEIAARIAA
jgi:hypothetical protein